MTGASSRETRRGAVS